MKHCFFLFFLVCIAFGHSEGAQSGDSVEAQVPDSASLSAARNPPWRIIYNNDTTNILNCQSPFNPPSVSGAPAGVLTEEKIRASVREACVEGIDAQVISPAHCWVAWWRSQRLPLAEHERWFRAHYGVEPDLAEHRYLLSGGDIIDPFIDECHKQGRAALISFRANDGHHLEQAFKAKPSGKVAHSCSRFYVEHPEYRLAPVGNEELKARVHDWAIAPARRYKEDMLAELIQNYPQADGIEIDFQRHPYYFRDDFPLGKRIEVMVDFLKKARFQLDEVARKTDGRHRWLGVRIPAWIAYRAGSWSDVGLDFAAWRAAGVDYFNLSANYDMTQQTDLAEARRRAGDAKIYQELTHTTMTWRMGGPGYDDHQFRRSTREALESTALLAYARGADGLSLFNFAYYRPHGGMLKYKAPFNEPLFGVVPALIDRTKLEQSNRYFYLRPVGDKCFSKKNQSFEFKMDILPAPDNGSAILRLLVVTDKERPQSELEPVADIDRSDWEVCVNARRLRRIKNPFAAYPFPTEIKSGFNNASQYVAYEVPPGVLVNGINTVSVQRTSADPLWLRWIEIVQPTKISAMRP